MAEPASDERPRENLIGEVLAHRYVIECHLGEGAMGSVYKARHVKVGRAFAVKVLHERLVEDPKVLRRFEREAELAGRLRHRNVVSVVDVGETAAGFRYMVMDFAEGADLATLLSEAPMPAERVINLTRQLLEGLFHAHEQGLIHRDFKPENVIVERDDHGAEVPRIVDFGIAILREGDDSTNAQGRLTTNGLVLGTPHYMAPEQAIADPIDHRIDLFALGIVIYEMLSGRLPFDGNGVEVARANVMLDPPVISQRVPFLEVDPLLEAFARRLMAKQRDQRPPTAKAARELLDLITRDRIAAATALGVPPATAVRIPAVTQPAAPVLPPELEAPAYPSVPSERALSTEAAEPLPFEPRRRRWGSVVLVVVALLVVAAVVMIMRRESPSEEPVALVPPPTVEPAPGPEPVLVREAAREPEPAPAPLVEPAPVLVTPNRRPPVTQSSAPPARPEVAHPEASEKTEVPSPSALFTLYQTVGAELAQVAKLDPKVAAEVELTYRHIQIQNAMATETSRARYGGELQRMARRLAAAKARQP